MTKFKVSSRKDTKYRKERKSLVSLNSRQKQNFDDKLRNRCLAAICVEISRNLT